MAQPLPRTLKWADTMAGHGAGSEVVHAHANSRAQLGPVAELGRVAREEHESATLRPGATLAVGAGDRAREEEPDDLRTCFERDRDRIVHSTSFRRLAGKTQVLVHPSDHQRTRLTHALEVAQVATSIARGVGANVSLADAIALGHDCGHGPGGHASEDAFDSFIDEGYDHGPWGANVSLLSLNLCAETLDGIRNHSWSRPAPGTVEGEIVSWADRIAYCAHDLEDAIAAGIVQVADLPREIVEVCGATRREQLGTFIRAVIRCVAERGVVGMDAGTASALAALRTFNYERIYTRPAAVAQARSVVEILQALVEHYTKVPHRVPGCAADPGSAEAVRSAVTWISGMTDRYAFETAVQEIGWSRADLPKAIDEYP